MIRKAYMRQWEAGGRADIIARFWEGLALALADELAHHGPSPQTEIVPIATIA